MNIFSNYNIYMYINCILYITNLFKKKNSKFIKEKKFILNILLNNSFFDINATLTIFIQSLKTVRKFFFRNSLQFVCHTRLQCLQRSRNIHLLCATYLSCELWEKEKVAWC